MSWDDLNCPDCVAADELCPSCKDDLALDKLGEVIRDEEETP